MDNAKHTSGPWRVNGDAELLDMKRIGSNTPINVVAVSGRVGWAITRHLAAISAGENIEERIANARLISAAPDLLAACENALEAMRDEWDGTDFVDQYTHPLVAAIALAVSTDTESL